MSLAQLRYFVAVAEDGTVRRAAERLHVAQPPLSRQIRALEDEIGARLFARTPRGMTLLPPGHALLDHARAILAAVDRAVAAARLEHAAVADAGASPHGDAVAVAPLERRADADPPPPARVATAPRRPRGRTRPRRAAP